MCYILTKTASGHQSTWRSPTEIRNVEGKLETLGLRLTVRAGIMLAAGLSLLGAVLKLH